MNTTTTETAELVGGPRDGDQIPYRRPAGADMPLTLPGLPRYQLTTLETRVHPPRWRYRWRPEHTGRRSPCRYGDRCPAAGCPNRHPGPA